MKNLRNTSGFTLIEIMIAIGILSILAFLTAQSISGSLRGKIQLQRGIDQQSSLRSAIQVIERDISLAFNYRDLDSQMNQEIEKSQQGDNPPPPAEPKPSTEPLFKTEFLGEKDSVNFTSLAHTKMMAGELASDQAEIGYTVKDCRSFRNPGKNSKCLWRRVDPIIDADIKEGGEETPLLEDIVKFELRYLGEGKEDWVDVWNSGEGADDVTRGKFPDAVEINVESNQDGKVMNYLTVVRLRMTNNQPPEDANASPPPGE